MRLRTLLLGTIVPVLGILAAPVLGQGDSTVTALTNGAPADGSEVFYVVRTSASAPKARKLDIDDVAAYVASVTGLGDLLDIDLTGLGDGDCLLYDLGTTTWLPGTCGGGGAGTVTSVAATFPNFLSVSGSPITTSGTLAVSLATQAANRVFAGPATGADAAPTFRALASEDIPNNAANTSGNAGTATALAANGANCSAGQAAAGVDASGAAEGCAAYLTDISGQTIGDLSDVDETGASPGAALVSDGAGSWAPSAAAVILEGDKRLSDDRYPTAHAASHAENATDELLIEGLGTACPIGETAISDGAGGLDCAEVGGAVGFADVGAGTNTGALLIGTGGSLGTSGTGTIAATSTATLNSSHSGTPEISVSSSAVTIDPDKGSAAGALVVYQNEAGNGVYLQLGTGTRPSVKGIGTGTLELGGNTTVDITSGASSGGGTTASTHARFQNSGTSYGLRLTSTSAYQWTNSSTAAGGTGDADTRLSRVLPGVVSIDTTTTGDGLGAIVIGGCRIHGSLASPPSAPVACWQYYDSDGGAQCVYDGATWHPWPSSGTCS